MKLTKVRIQNFQCIHDSTEFDVDDITCLVGKNESGKTAILKALHGFNPMNSAASYSRDDYPVSKNDIINTITNVIEVTFAIEKEAIDKIEEFTTCECFKH